MSSERKSSPTRLSGSGLSNDEIETILVERQPTIGGVMAQLNKTFPTMDCSI